MNRFGNAVRNAPSESAEEAREMAENYARGYCPVDTGELLESIYSYPIRNGFRLGANAKHAVFNEFGSITTPIGDPSSPLPAKYVGVRPFLRPALFDVARDYPKVFNRVFMELIGHG